MAPQFKVTGPSLSGMSTELDNITTCGDQHSHKYVLEKTTHSSKLFNIVQLSARYRVDMDWCLRKVFEYEDKIQLFERKLSTFQGCDLDFVESDDEEKRVDKVDETFSGRL